MKAKSCSLDLNGITVPYSLTYRSAVATPTPRNNGTGKAFEDTQVEDKTNSLPTFFCCESAMNQTRMPEPACNKRVNKSSAE